MLWMACCDADSTTTVQGSVQSGPCDVLNHTVPGLLLHIVRACPTMREVRQVDAWEMEGVKMVREERAMRAAVAHGELR